MRFENWPTLLSNYIKSCESKPFVWGEHDCCLFAANVINEITGVDYAVEIRDTYKTAREALKVLENFEGVSGLACNYLGSEINSNLAQRGDVVLIKTEEHGDTLAICTGTSCVAPGLKKLTSVSMANAIKAWRVK